MTLTINPAFADRRVSHHNCCKTVGEHNPYELKDLAIVALKSGNTLLLECFIDLPTLDEIVQDQTATQIHMAETAAPALTPVYNTSDIATSSIAEAKETKSEKALDEE